MTAFADWLAGHAAALDDAGLERWCGPLLFARGRADLAAGPPPAIELADDRAIVRVGAEVVEVTRTGIPGCSCSCPARACRHRVIGALALRDRFAAAAPAAIADGPAKEGGPEEPRARSARIDPEGGPVEPRARSARIDPEGGPVEPRARSARIDAETARARFGARPWKRAQTALARGVVVELHRDAAGLTAVFAGTGVSCTFHAELPLESATCSCRKPFPCDHRAIAIAALLAGVPDSPPVRAAAETLDSITALCHEIVATGLDHAHAGWVRAAVRLAVVAHAAALPRLERELEDLAEQLELARRRSARFELRGCAIAIARIALRVRLLATRPADHELAGSFHRSYLDAGSVELACLGAQPFTTADGVDGVRLHCHDGAGFAVATIVTERERAVHQPWRARRVRFDRPVWGAAPWQELVGARLRLDNARRAADGTIASSPATRAAIIGRFEPCELDLGPHRVTDWRALAARVAATPPFPIGDPPPAIVAIVVPHAIARPRRVAAAIEAELVDAGGRIARLIVAPRRGNEAARHDAIARLIERPPTQILATAQRHAGELGLAPIAFYRRGEPIACLGLGEPIAAPPDVPASPHATPGEPLDPVWCWLEDVVAGGVGAPRAHPAPIAPFRSLAPFLARAHRDPGALLAAIAATAIADDVEGRVALCGD